MRKVGCFVGKFLPPHIGHLSVIDKALKECEKVVVVLAENPERSEKLCKEANFPYFPATTRLEWLKQHYKNHNNIKFVFLDESGLKPFPEGLAEWSQRFKAVVKDKITAKYADESYRQLNEKFFPECEFVPIDRDIINIHGTDIRKNKNNIKYMISEGIKQTMEYFEKGEKYE